jgi:hypothetical protein
LRKRIAVLLIMFMAGTWSVHADDGLDRVTIGVFVILGVGAVVLGGILIYMVVVGGEGEALLREANRRLNNSTLDAVINNPILRHGSLGFTQDKAFVGFRFAW